MSLPTYHLEYGHHLARLRRRCAYAPTSNTTSQKTMRKSTHGFPFASYMGMGLRLVALRAAGAPLLHNGRVSLYETWLEPCSLWRCSVIMVCSLKSLYGEIFVQVANGRGQKSMSGQLACFHFFFCFEWESSRIECVAFTLRRGNSKSDNSL